MTSKRTASRAALALAVWAAAGGAGAAEVAILKSSEVPAWRPALEALRRAISSHTVSEHDLRGDPAEAARVANSLKDRPVILVALGPLAAQVAREALLGTPLVFCMVQDPAKVGLNLGPGVSGVSFSIPVKNQLAAFRMVNPRGVRIGVVYSEANVGRLIADAQQAASLVRVALMSRPVASERDVPQALRSLLTGPEAVDALWIPPDPVLLGEESQRHILSETLRAGRPVYSFSSALVEKGALVSNGPDFTSIGELAGELVNRMAAGEKGKIDMLVPKAELVINKRIAGKLKIEIPPEALKAAARTF